MKVECKKSEQFHTDIIDFLEQSSEANIQFQKMIVARARGIAADVINSTIGIKKYFGDVIELSVSVAIGDPEEEDKSLNDEEDE